MDSEMNTVEVLEQGKVPENEAEAQTDPSKDKENDSDDWKTEQFRLKVKDMIQEEIMKASSAVPKSGAYFEDFAFSKATSRKQYLDLVTKCVKYVGEYNSKKLKAEAEKAEGDTEEKKAEEAPSEL